jgi:thiol-disulfide isomerase/thioredoxin
LFLILLFFCLPISVLSEEPVARAYVFYSPTCIKCLAMNELLPQLQEKYSLEIKYFNIEEYENYEKLVQLEEEYKVSKSGLPEIFIENQTLVGEKEIKEKLEQKIKDVIEQGGSSWPGNVKEPKEDLVVKRFKSFNQLAVLSAGLIDGINPCAFTTAIFFITFLGFIGKGKKEIILVGVFFTFSVFTTYLLIGLGVFNFLRGMENFAWISKCINFGVASFAILLGGINLYDYYKFKKGKNSEMVLKLSDNVKKVIHSVIRTNMNSRSLIFAALITGFFVTLLESVCTGQVYLPTILCVLKTPGLQSQAFLYLVIYNLMFIAPLALIFGLTFFGISSNRFSGAISKNLGAIKILNSLFFFIIGFILIIYFLIVTP